MQSQKHPHQLHLLSKAVRLLHLYLVNSIVLLKDVLEILFPMKLTICLAPYFLIQSSYLFSIARNSAGVTTKGSFVKCFMWQNHYIIEPAA